MTQNKPNEVTGNREDHKGCVPLRYLPPVWYPVLAIALLVACSSFFLVRDLWFDEALTVLNFALQPKLEQVYTNYSIPNNHIVYTLLLRFWIAMTPDRLDVVSWMRLLSLIFGLGTIFLFCRIFRNSWGSCITAFLLASSFPMCIESTGVRGYALSGFLTLSLCFVVRSVMQRETWGKLAGFTILCVLAVGVMPSNVMAVFAILLYAFARRYNSDDSFFHGENRRSLFCCFRLGICSLVAFFLFYGPIWKQFLACAKLHEGVTIRQAYAGTYGSFFWFFFPVILISLGGVFFGKKRGNRISYLLYVLFFLFPAFMIPVMAVPPFPRIFFPVFLVWLLALTEHYPPLNRSHAALFFPAAFFSLIFCIANFSTRIPEAVSNLLFDEGRADDFFYPYYVRREHTPSQTVHRLGKLLAESGTHDIYLTFSADPWAIMFYGTLAGLDADYKFDGPQGPVTSLSEGTVLIAHRGSPFPETQLHQRFHMNFLPWFETDSHSVYRCVCTHVSPEEKPTKEAN